MRGAWVGAAVCFLLLAGCLGHATPKSGPAPSQAALPPAPAYRDGACDSLLLFQFVDFRETDGYLPPGFHPRDPRDFLDAPVAIGQAGVLFLELSCDSEDDGHLDEASLSIFVESPAVPGLDPARFDFYELQRYGPAGPFGSVLSATAWPTAEAGVGVQVQGGMLGNATSGTPAGTVTSVGMANVTDADGTLAAFTAVLGASVRTIGEGAVRFWHDNPDGLAFIEYQARLDALVGSGTCSARPGTPLAAFLGEAPLLGTPSCPPGDPVFATFPGLKVSGTARALPGVHAG